jgi:REP element-mobilizing transposase RayT
MRSRYRVHDSSLPQFVTGTIVQWLPVFTTSTMCDVLVESLRFCQQHKGLRITAWVILDNHFHAVVSAPELSDVLAQVKRFTARQIVQQLRVERREWLLNQLHFFCPKHKAQSEYQVWQEGSHPQAIRNDSVMQQKRDYIHLNPTRRGLVSAPEHWRYSSAHEWLEGSEPVLRCDDWR